MDALMQVSFRRTIVGFYNVSLAGSSDFINVSPDQFHELLPDVSPKARYGCGTISRQLAEELFSGDVTEVYSA